MKGREDQISINYILKIIHDIKKIKENNAKRNSKVDEDCKSNIPKKQIKTKKEHRNTKKNSAFHTLTGTKNLK